ncbi:MAG: response regulator [Phycisphaerales bacterium]
MTGHRLRILHADDDDSFRLLVERVATADPHLSTCCRFEFVFDGTDAVDYVRGNGRYVDRVAYPMPHMIILDQRMVQMDGVEALREIKRIPTALHIPVFLLSTSTQHHLLEACYALGASFCITKPLDFQRLLPLLSRLVDFAIDVLELPAAERF